MKQIYTRIFTVTFSTGDSGYVYADKISPGNVLRVETCFAYAPERAASEEIILGIKDGAENIIIRATAPLAAQKGVSTENPFSMGEGDQLFAYFPSAEDADQLGIHVIGVLYSLDEWRKIRE
ncbi:MAG: hypothetical protein E3J94_01290 [Desulfobacteraceae bacterium]|nr:MAG: hypothetical protein E3J94_01290 [Desulfobacteraceae bacterium]